ncbi:MAG: biopolymer transporter ExbD [Planctomycetota bacterium]
MRLPTHATRRDAGANMTPMIDVVFLLIIFFLVSSHLARQETQAQLDLPQAATGDNDADDLRPRVTINVLPAGRPLLSGVPTPVDQLAARLRHEQSQAAAGLEVRIRTDRAARYAAVEPILLACAEAGVWKVTFAVTEKR